MKPTPTRLALLLSAAGLGMSLPGAAMAQADPFERLLSALTSGAHQKNDLACEVAEYGASMPCRPAPAGALAAESPGNGAVVSGSSRAAVLVEPSPPNVAAHRLRASSKAMAPTARLSMRQSEAVAPTDTRKPIPAAEARGESVPTRRTPDDERHVGGDGRIGREIHADQIASAAQAVPKVPPPTPPTMPAAPAVPLRLLSLESVVFEEVASPQPQVTLEMQPVLGRPPRQPNRGEASPSTPLRNVAALAAPNAIAFGEDFTGQLASVPPQLAASAGRDGGKSTADRSTASPERPAASPPKAVAMGQFQDGSNATTGHSKWATPSARTSIDSNPSSVFGINRAGLAESDAAAVATKAKATTSAGQVTAGLAPPTPSVATGVQPAYIGSLSASDDVIVGTHRDRVMMSLATLLASDDPVSGRLGAQPGQTVVASHSEKVLATLAHVRMARPLPLVRTAGSTAGEAVDDTGMPEWGAPVVPPAPRSATRGAAADPTDLVELGATAVETTNAPPAASRRSQPTVPSNPIGDQVVALGAERLDDVRGGFTMPDGLKVSFGIERAVYLNGDLVTTTSLNVSELSRISGGRAQVSTTGPGSLALVQSGLGNAFQPGTISQTAAGTVIQNTLDNQKIQTITRIDAVVNSSSIIRSMNLQSSMRSAVVDSLRR